VTSLLLVTSLLVTVALVAAACSSSGEGAGEIGSGLGVSTTTAAGVAGDGVLDPSGEESGDGSDSSPLVDAAADAPGTAQTTGPLPPNQLGAPHPGEYRYRISDDGDVMGYFVFDRLGDQSRQSFDRTGELEQLHIEWDTEERAKLHQWRPDGLHLDQEQRRRGESSGAVCDFEPDLLLVPRPLTAGFRWMAEATCSAESGGVTVTRDRTIEGQVIGPSTAEVDGATVPTVEVHRIELTTTTSDSTPPLLLTERRELTVHWIVDTGLAARVDGTIVETVSGAPRTPRSFTQVLLSLDPRT
jgi:hypothetical protein